MQCKLVRMVLVMVVVVGWDETIKHIMVFLRNAPSPKLQRGGIYALSSPFIGNNNDHETCEQPTIPHKSHLAHTYMHTYITYYTYYTYIHAYIHYILYVLYIPYMHAIHTYIHKYIHAIHTYIHTCYTCYTCYTCMHAYIVFE